MFKPWGRDDLTDQLNRLRDDKKLQQARLDDAISQEQAALAEAEGARATQELCRRRLHQDSEDIDALLDELP